jgi:hypothetical protein
MLGGSDRLRKSGHSSSLSHHSRMAIGRGQARVFAVTTVGFLILSCGNGSGNPSSASAPGAASSSPSSVTSSGQQTAAGALGPTITFTQSSAGGPRKYSIAQISPLKATGPSAPDGRHYVSFDVRITNLEERQSTLPPFLGEAGSGPSMLQFGADVCQSGNQCHTCTFWVVAGMPSDYLASTFPNRCATFSTSVTYPQYGGQMDANSSITDTIASEQPVTDSAIASASQFEIDTPSGGSEQCSCVAVLPLKG